MSPAVVHFRFSGLAVCGADDYAATGGSWQHPGTADPNDDTITCQECLSSPILAHCRELAS